MDLSVPNHEHIVIAGVWRHYFSFLIDQVFLLILFIPLLVWIGERITLLTIMPGALLMLGYSVWLEGKYGQTIGKYVFSIKTVKIENPGKTGIGYLDAAIRTFIKSFDQKVGVGGLWAFLNTKRQTWHDLAVKTVVIHDPIKKFSIRVLEDIPLRKKYVWIFLLCAALIVMSIGVDLWRYSECKASTGILCRQELRFIDLPRQ